MDQPDTSYPVQLSIDYPDRPLNRLTTFLRLITIIPIFIVLVLVENFSDEAFAVGAGGLLVLPPLVMILFRRKYPRWWFDWNLALLKFSNRVFAYLFLLSDEYPSTDDEQAVHLDIAYPDVESSLNRWLPLVKWLLAIPHYIVLLLLTLALLVVVILVWFVLLFTARYPRDMFDFVVGVMRWYNRVTGYALIMVTDRYPPFRLSP